MTQPPDRTAFLRGTALFSDLAEAHISELAAGAVVERLARNQAVFQVGDAPDGLRVVISGLLRVWISDPSGREMTLTLIEPGEELGEIALLDGAPRSANVTAMEKTETLLIRRAAFQRLLNDRPEVQMQIITLLCHRLRTVTDHVGAVALMSLRRRVATKLVALAQSHAVSAPGGGARFRRKFSQSELADMIGVTREAINKQLAALAADRLLSLEGGRIAIPDLAALEHVAEAG